MALFKNWIQNIAMIIIFSSFVELLVPRNNFKKYTQMIMGLMIIFSIIQPITSVIRDPTPFHLIVSQHELNVDQIGIQNQVAWLSKEHEKQAIKVFQDKLQEQIKEQVKNETSVKDAEVTVVMNTNVEEQEFGQIQEMHISITPQNSDIMGKDKIVERVKVSKIDIDPKRTMKENTNSLEEVVVIKNIKNSLSSFYNLSPSNINISVQNR